MLMELSLTPERERVARESDSSVPRRRGSCLARAPNCSSHQMYSHPLQFSLSPIAGSQPAPVSLSEGVPWPQNRRRTTRSSGSSSTSARRPGTESSRSLGQWTCGRTAPTTSETPIRAPSAAPAPSPRDRSAGPLSCSSLLSFTGLPRAPLAFTLYPQLTQRSCVRHSPPPPLCSSGDGGDSLPTFPGDAGAYPDLRESQGGVRTSTGRPHRLIHTSVKQTAQLLGATCGWLVWRAPSHSNQCQATT